MKFINARILRLLLQPFLPASLGLALVFTSACDHENDPKYVFSHKTLTKSPQGVKTAMATLNRQASGIANDDIRQVAISATIDTGGYPLFGLTGGDVPVTVVLLMQPGIPSEYYDQSETPSGNTLGDDFLGYAADRIVAFYLRVGEVEGTGKEVTWVDPALNAAAAAANPPLDFLDHFLPDGAPAPVWFNGNPWNAAPTAMAQQVQDGSYYYRIGSMTGGGLAVFNFDYTVHISDGTHFGEGPLGSIEVTDVSREVAGFLARARKAANDLLKAHRLSDKADKLAKRKGVKPQRFPAAKRAEKKVATEARDFAEVLLKPMFRF